MRTELFGEIISSYSRAQAIADGELVVVKGESGNLFKCPVALTRSLFCQLERGNGKRDDVLIARIWDVYYMAKHGKVDGPDSFFKVIVGRETLHLRANCCPGDGASPVITIGHPSDF